MKRLNAWIAYHPVAAFFSLAYFFSWPLFAVVLFVAPRNMVLQGTLGSVAVFAPAMAAMVVARAVDPGRVESGRVSRWTAFLAGWVVAWTVLVLFAFQVRHAPVVTPMVVFSGVLALLPAFVLSRAFSPAAGIRRHFRSLLAPRGNLSWYLLALLAVPAVQLAGAGITWLFGARGGSHPLADIPASPSIVALFFLHGLLFAGGINEESGWRGFALPLLQRRYSPLAAALVVWVFWALWHLPMDLASRDGAVSILMNRGVLNAIWSVLFMWVFNRTKGSLLAPALFHPAMNTSGMLLPRTDAATVLFIVLVLGAVVSDRMWRRLPTDHPALLRDSGG